MCIDYSTICTVFQARNILIGLNIPVTLDHLRGFAKPIRGPEWVTLTADKISGFECKFLSIWFHGKFYQVSIHECQIEGLMVTMSKVLADRLGIDYHFDLETPEYIDEKFSWDLFRNEVDSYKSSLTF